MNENMNYVPKWAKFVSLLLFVAGIVMFSLMGMAVSDFERQYATNNSMIGDLLVQIENLNVAVNEVDTETVASSKLQSCADLGNKVADLQTKYQNISPSDDYDIWMENVEALDSCFVDSAKESRVPWFIPVREHEVIWKWEFQSTYSFTSKQVDVIWLCRDVNNGDIIAYCTAVYDTEVGLFEMADWTVTSIGFTYQQDNMDESGGNDYVAPDELPNDAPDSDGSVGGIDAPDSDGSVGGIDVEFDPGEFEDYTGNQ